MAEVSWNDLSAEEKARVIAWLRQDVCGEQVPQPLRAAAADELESPTWAADTEPPNPNEPVW